MKRWMRNAEVEAVEAVVEVEAAGPPGKPHWNSPTLHPAARTYACAECNRIIAHAAQAACKWYGERYGTQLDPNCEALSLIGAQVRQRPGLPGCRTAGQVVVTMAVVVLVVVAAVLAVLLLDSGGAAGR